MVSAEETEQQPLMQPMLKLRDSGNDADALDESRDVKEEELGLTDVPVPTDPKPSEGSDGLNNDRIYSIEHAISRVMLKVILVAAPCSLLCSAVLLESMAARRAALCDEGETGGVVSVNSLCISQFHASQLNW